MDRMLFLAMSGASEMMQAQAAAAHNLANVNTSGFRADLNQFRSMPVFGEGHPSRVYAMDERPGVDLQPGALIETGNELDIAVKGEGWIAVQAPDGSEGYTRKGNLEVSSEGLLLTQDGLPVLGDAGPIAIPPFEKLEIAADGTISIRPQGQDPNTISQVERIRLVNPDKTQLQKGEDGLLHLPAGQKTSPDSSVSIVSGMLETSNVNAIAEMARMINVQRHFELLVKAMNTAQENDAADAQLLRLA